jgi:hypothetical protein
MTRREEGRKKRFIRKKVERNIKQTINLSFWLLCGCHSRLSGIFLKKDSGQARMTKKEGFQTDPRSLTGRDRLCEDKSWNDIQTSVELA